MNKAKYLLIVFGSVGVIQLIESLLINFEYKYLINRGIAFSIFEESYTFGIFLNVLGIVCLSIFCINNLKEIKQIKIPLTMLLIGGISNLVDRVIYGGVVDFIIISVLPMFNIADVLIVIGIMIIFFKLFNMSRDEKSISGT